VEFVRTPSGCFQDLPGFPYQLKSVDIGGLRQGYVDEGPADAPVVLLLHGQPTWAFLYRKMIPVLVDAGYRAIAMDHLGMGFSDKPVDIADYSYLGHIDRLEKFISALGLRDITSSLKIGAASSASTSPAKTPTGLRASSSAMARCRSCPRESSRTPESRTPMSSTPTSSSCFS